MCYVFLFFCSFYSFVKCFLTISFGKKKLYMLLGKLLSVLCVYLWFCFEADVYNWWLEGNGDTSWTKEENSQFCKRQSSQAGKYTSQEWDKELLNKSVTDFLAIE